MTERTVVHATFAIERTYDATPGRLFAAWADPAAKSAWFNEGESWDIQSYEFDFREGGRETCRFRFLKGKEMFGEETMLGSDTIFNEIVPNERIIFTYAMDRNDVRFSVSLACVELSPADSGARLVFTEHVAFFEGGDGAKMREAGWRALLDKLADYLAG